VAKSLNTTLYNNNNNNPKWDGTIKLISAENMSMKMNYLQPTAKPEL